jgi:hypothetical protein
MLLSRFTDSLTDEERKIARRRPRLQNQRLDGPEMCTLPAPWQLREALVRIGWVR